MLVPFALILTPQQIRSLGEVLLVHINTCASVTIRRDAMPPTFTATRVTATPASGWTNQNVTVRFDATDAQSGLGTASSIQVTMTQEGADLTARRTFIDLAGNHAIASLGGITSTGRGRGLASASRTCRRTRRPLR